MNLQIIVRNLFGIFALAGFSDVLADANLGPQNTVEYAQSILADDASLMPEAPDLKGIATTYGQPGDKYAQQGTACAPHNKINDVDHVCAHRWYPCGTILIVENIKNGKRNWCVVKDRGPYGANVFADNGTKVMNDANKPAWFIKIRPGDLPPASICPMGNCIGRWRGILDMSPAVSAGLDHPGMGMIKVWRLTRIVELRKYIANKQPVPTI